MKLDNLNFKVGQKFIKSDLLRRVEKNFLNIKKVDIEEYNKNDNLTLFVKYDNNDIMMIETKKDGVLFHIIDITLNK